MDRYELIITNGTVVTPQGERKLDIAVSGGKIAAMAQTPAGFEGKETVDARGLLVLPGGVDAHVHFEDPGMTDWEDWEHGSLAAAAGGITTVADMPVDNIPPTTDAQSLLLKKAAALERSNVDFALWGGLTAGAKPEEMLDGGAAGLKAFLAECGGPYFPVADSGTLYEGMKAAASRGKPVTVHCEDAEAVDYYTRQCLEAPPFDNGSWSRSRPVLAELLAVNKVMFLAGLTGARVNVAHISSPEVADLIAQGRAGGIDVTAETCAHYLYFDGGDVLRRGTALKCSPPIRPDEKTALWECVKDGRISTVASDHSPTSMELRELYADDMYRGSGGISGVQFTLNVLYSEGVKKHGLSLERLTEVFSSNAARALGLYGRKGAVAEGFDADLVLFDPAAVWTVDRADYLAKVKYSPYIGETFTGRVRATYVRGQRVYCQGEQPRTRTHFAQMLEPENAEI